MTLISSVLRTFVPQLQNQPEMLTILFSDQISSPSFGTQQESKGIAPKLEVSYHLILVQCNTSPTRQQNGDRYQEYVDFSKTVLLDSIF